MNKIGFIFRSILTFFLLTIANINVYGSQEKISFWDNMQKGTNIFNHKISREDIKAAKDYGIAFIRFAPDKFFSAKRDFLIGDADNYIKLVPEDLKALKDILNICAEEGMPVVLTFLTLPGSRWKQNNNEKDDLRLWTEIKFQNQAAKFWHDLALELKNHSAIMGYNILNEPHPERIYNAREVHIYKVNQQEIQTKLFNFYKLVIEAIRRVDQSTPIILESSAYSDAKTFKDFKIHSDPNILYSFHIYEPYEYTCNKINKGRFAYPGEIHGTYWRKNELKNYMEEVSKFQKINNISPNRIFVGEFGAHRSSKGIVEYFRDLTYIFKENGWHFAFYAFREDTWDGMDYELGDKKLPWSYWQAIDQGVIPQLDRCDHCPQFKVLKDAL